MGQGSFPPQIFFLKNLTAFLPSGYLRVFLFQFRGYKNLPMARSQCSWPLEIGYPHPHDSHQRLKT